PNDFPRVAGPHTRWSFRSTGCYSLSLRSVIDAFSILRILPRSVICCLLLSSGRGHSPVLSAPYLTRSSETPARTAKSTHCASQKSFPSSMFSYAHKDVLLVVWRPSGPHCKVCSNFSHAARYHATEPIAHSYGTSRCPLSLGARDSDRRRV